MVKRVEPVMMFMAAVFLLLIVAIIVIADEGLGPHLFPWAYQTPGMDKVGHVTLMGMLAYLLNRAMRGRVRLVTTSLLVAVTLEEVSQLFTRNRRFDPGDLACDVVGIVMAAWVAHKLFTAEITL